MIEIDSRILFSLLFIAFLIGIALTLCVDLWIGRRYHEKNKS